MSVKHLDESLVNRCNAPQLERNLIAGLIADPKDDRVPAKVKPQRENAHSGGSGRKSLKSVRHCLERNVPAVIDPRRMCNSDLAKHLGRKVQDCERFVIVLECYLWPMAH